jgi:2-hydroxyglutarate dehydrogenase
MRKLFKGGNYSRAETIRGNTVFYFWVYFIFFISGSALEGRVLHCRNAPSPGATSSLAIARMLANKMEDTFTLPKRSNAILY